jgi:uncharacterized membrane protein YhaH (DUF805 family)
MGFKNAVTTCFRKYATFSGRARRSEYWWFMLFVGLCGGLVNVLFANENGGGFIPWLFEAVVFLPTLAVTWRRMHDIGKGGLWGLIDALPWVGWIFLLVWTTRNSQPGPNRFGPNPKEWAPWTY